MAILSLDFTALRSTPLQPVGARPRGGLRAALQQGCEGLDAHGPALEGSIGLPNNRDAIFPALQHWAGLLAEWRTILEAATWSVRVEDRELRWDEALGAYDLS